MSTSVPAPPGPPAPTGPPAPIALPPDSALTVDPYNQGADLSQIFTPEQREELKQNRLSSFSTGAAIVLSIVVGWLFNLIFYGLMSDQLPKIKEDDPSAGKFIGFHFIPFYNLYWIFVAWPRLLDRINLQYRLRGMPGPINRGQAITICILLVCGPVTIFLTWIAAFVISIIAVSQTQDAVNGLAAERGA